ncbi:MAG TPA: Zn-dependent hydrolase [Candidatus Limnocylindria bacterium]|nr:Zn-dependent hydrolase [Candidatus Limnocylindria bacterium]
MPAASREFSVHDLANRLAALSDFGSAGAGVTRLAYDPAWLEAHRWLRDEADRLGLDATSDWAGNLFFHSPDIDPDTSEPVLLVGSHLDSVVGGGRFDGAFGVVSGLLTAASLQGQPGVPIVGFATAEEEDSRFHGGMMGARSLLGLVSPDELDAVRDADGVSWAEALAVACAEGCAAPMPSGLPPRAPRIPLARSLELHVEQGPTLEAEGLALGIVTRVAGYRRWRARFDGEARHSGTTPMGHRKDALAAAAELVLAVESLARERGEPAVGTAGRIEAEPGLFNVVPGRCEVWLELRHSESRALDVLETELGRRAAGVAERRGLALTFERVSTQEPSALDATLGDAARDVAAELGVTSCRMVSGAAHDTMVFARSGVPSLLLFVPSQGGISHSPDEYTDAEQLFAGHRVGLELCRRLSARSAT